MKKVILKKTNLFLFLFILLLPEITFAQNIIWKKNFGSLTVGFNSVAATPDAIIAVGAGIGCNVGDLEGIEGTGIALVVKYDYSGNVIEKSIFGGDEMSDYFVSVTIVDNGIVAAGFSGSASFNTGDWVGITGKGGDDAIIVKYDHNGNLLWKKNFGGAGHDRFICVKTVSDGIVAVGSSTAFGTGDWEEIDGKGEYDAIIVKYDHNGNVLWKRNFGGKGMDAFSSVAPLSDGIIAVGISDGNSFGNGDWEGIPAKGRTDGTVVKYDYDGNILWKKNFGGNGGDNFKSVLTQLDGFIVVGTSSNDSFGNGDWETLTAKGFNDATIIKYDYEGNVVWKNNFGGSSFDEFNSVTQLSDGVVAVGVSFIDSFNNGDWEGIKGKSGHDGIIVKYDHDGNILWKNNFGGSGGKGAITFSYASTIDNNVVSVGNASCNTFGTGDWEGIECKGLSDDAIIVKFSASGVNIDEPKKELPNIILYPNPTTGELTIDNGQLTINSVEVFDIYGKKQLSNHLITTSSHHKIDISNLSAGIYFVKITTEQGEVVKKVVKQ